MIRRLLFSVAFFSLLLIPAAGFAYDSGICTSGSTCTSSEVGALMDGVSKECGNLGNCSLDDIMTVFINTGNYVIGVVGAVVLLMYVIGGIYMLTSGGKQERVQKGKKYLTVSTVGMLIVMFAYVGILSLKSGLQYGNFKTYQDVEGFLYNCTEDTIGETCGLNKTCTEDLQCVDQCTQTHGGEVLEAEYTSSSKYSVYKCVDKNEVNTVSDDTDPYAPHFDKNTCTANLCPGDEDVQCCQYFYYQKH